MISLEEAQQLILNEITPLPSEKAGLAAASGRVLAEDIYAGRSIPPHNNSAMDGYAVRAAEVAGASDSQPVKLRLVGELTAGAEVDLSIAPGEAIAVMTGAPLPDGANAVVQQEFTQQRGSEVEFYHSPKVGEHIRKAGEDITKGELALRRGSFISPPALGLLAALGRASVMVSRQPQVAILATGNELVEVGQPTAKGKIYNSNSYLLAAQVSLAGGAPQLLGIAPDDPKILADLLRKGMGRQVLITSGGVSVGKYDLVKTVLEDLGMKRIFWRVAIKPGKPTLFGVLGSTLVFGLPGNPTSAAITFELFLRPALDLLLGRKCRRQPFLAKAASTIRKKKGRKNFLRVNLEQKGGELLIRQQNKQGAGILSSLQDSDGMAVLPGESELIGAGEMLEFRPWPWREK